MNDERCSLDLDAVWVQYINTCTIVAVGPGETNRTMITFLPTSDFKQCATLLDSKRLGNQRVEARMILRWLRNPTSYPRQQNSGYTIMWKGYEDALCLYYNACCEEWANRGGKNIICQPEKVDTSRKGKGKEVTMPPWLGDDRLHQNHRSALLYKLKEHYGKYGWADEIAEPKVEYLWPRPVEGKDGEYELCPPAYWKKNKTATKEKANSVNKTKTKTKPAATKGRAIRKTTTPMKKTSVVKKGGNANKQRKAVTSCHLRRSPRLKMKNKI